MSEIFTLEKIWNAYIDCLKRKKNTTSALKFEIDREKNLLALLEELESRRYEISRHICFVVTDPTPREIFAANFRDRVIHHLLYAELKDLFEGEFIENSFANREDKGTHKGVRKLQEYLKVTERGTYYLKLDIKSFFCSINKDILFRIVEQKIMSADKSVNWKEDILWLTKKVIYHDPTKNYFFKGDLAAKKLIPPDKSLFFAFGNGLPIGNLTSQFFANIYLNELDKYVLSLGNVRYIRYVDDFILLGNREIKNEIERIRAFLWEKLKLKISDKKIRFQQIEKGVDFLGYYIKPGYVLVGRKIVQRFKQKMRLESGRKIETVNSYFGHFSHANTFRLRKSICEKYFVKSTFKIKGEYKSIKTI